MEQEINLVTDQEVNQAVDLGVLVEVVEEDLILC